MSSQDYSLEIFQEEEDDYDDYNDDEDIAPVSNQSAGHKKWRQAVIKDITSCSGRSLTRSDSLDGDWERSETGQEDRLSLKEVGHIRQVLARAELEADSGSEGLVGSVSRGEVCGVCRVSRFSRIRPSVECSLCSQMTCRACLTDMSGRVSRDTTYHISDIPPSLLAPGSLQSDPASCPPRDNCAGSAPTSPRPGRQAEDSPPPPAPPLLPPPVTSRSSLTGLSRRWSLVLWPLQAADTNRVVICLLCRNIVKQVSLVTQLLP